MQARRGGMMSCLEWAAAAGGALLLAGIGGFALREAESVNAVTPVIARETPVRLEAPPGIPSGAVSVPVLLLADGREVHVGDTLAEIAARLGRQAEVGRQIVPPAAGGDRLVRFYEHAGTQFVLVFEPLASGVDPRVVAIYAQ